MRAKIEAEIDSDILRHDARNLQLKRRLAERGIDFRGERPIICNFRGSQPAASLSAGASAYRKRVSRAEGLACRVRRPLHVAGSSPG
jgi:hypothetical protein